MHAVSRYPEERTRAALDGEEELIFGAVDGVEFVSPAGEDFEGLVFAPEGAGF